MEDKLTKYEFEKFYKQRLEPYLETLEIERKKYIYKLFGCIIMAIIFIAIGFFVYKSGSVVSFLFFAISIIAAVYVYILYKDERNCLKDKVLSKVLQLSGNVYRSPNTNLIPLSDIHLYGLFPHAERKNDDDVLVGIYNGCNFIIDESVLTHEEYDYYASRPRKYTVTDFNGLILKVQIKKKFIGTTVIVPKNQDYDGAGYSPVSLESVDFMATKKVFSTDQIEARYILTPSLMEKLDTLDNTFNGSNIDINLQQKRDKSLWGKFRKSFTTPPSIVFNKGYVTLFITKSVDLFEISTFTTLLNPAKYYNIYLQITSIFDLIDFLDVDKNLGL